MPRHLLLLLFSLFTLHATAYGDSLTLIEQTALLPSSAQTFLRKHFATLSVKQVTVERGFLKKEYSVRLAGGGQVEFDAQGNWTRIEGVRNAIPASTIPSKILQYIHAHYPAFFISSLDRTDGGYQTVLRGLEQEQRLDLLFNGRYELVRIDEEQQP